MRLTLLASTLFMGFVLGVGCSSEEGATLKPAGAGGTSSGGSLNGTGGSGATSIGSSFGGTGGTGAGGEGATTPVAACEGLPTENAGGEGGACAGTDHTADPIDVAMYIMLDKSISMEEGDPSRWSVVTDAVKEFVQDPDVANVEVGLQFFSYEGEDDCDAGRYSNPAVPIGLAPDVAGDIVDAIDDQFPSGQTPTAPALQGAVDYAKEYAAEHEQTRTVVVFVTDGFPTRCPDGGAPISQIAEIAAEAWGNEPQVNVYAVGIDGTFNLDQIALAGGTGQAFNVENDGSTERFVSTLIAITREQVLCEYNIPEPPEDQLLDYEEVQVIYTPSDGDPEEIPFQADGVDACNGAENGGWYYDNPMRPRRILTCPCTCSRFGAGTVQVRLGCKPQIDPG